MIPNESDSIASIQFNQKTQDGHASLLGIAEKKLRRLKPVSRLVSSVTFLKALEGTFHMARITVVGLGYVGLSIACLLAQHNAVTAVDISNDKVELVNKGVSPIKDKEISAFLAQRPSTLRASNNGIDSYQSADFIVIATPTDYDDQTNYFDTSSIESVIEDVAASGSTATVVIKSTVPVGYSARIAKRFSQQTIIFSPEFLREGHALADNYHPSRIVVGATTEASAASAEQFARLLAEGAHEEAPCMVMHSTEAESIKLFANTFLALRVSFFNELDTYAEAQGLDPRNIIKGVCHDPRIGDYYNNPSFGYGGYCLPKDSKQLLANYQGVPQNLIKAIVDSNTTRKSFIAQDILSRSAKTIGIYRLTMKEGSDNFRQSAILDVIAILKKHGASLLIYEPSAAGNELPEIPFTNSLAEFKKSCDLIVANRWDDELSDVSAKVYTRDLWHRD